MLMLNDGRNYCRSMRGIVRVLDSGKSRSKMPLDGALNPSRAASWRFLAPLSTSRHHPNSSFLCSIELFGVVGLQGMITPNQR